MTFTQEETRKESAFTKQQATILTKENRRKRKNHGTMISLLILANNCNRSEAENSL
jgi:hypothetical protein